MAAKSQVVLQGCPLQDEGLCASAVIKPGHLLLKNTDGTVRPHNSAAATVLNVLVAVERTEIGEGIGDSYAIGDTVKYVRPAPGDKLTMWLSSGETVVVEGRLESNGDGTLQAVTTGQAPFRAAEAMTASGDTKIQVYCVDS